MKLSKPQQALLEEIRTAGVLYVRSSSRYGRTIGVLRQRGLVKVVEPDYSPLRMDGYSVTEDIREVG